MRQARSVSRPFRAPLVILRAELHRGLLQEVAQGVIDYAGRHGPWELQLDAAPEPQHSTVGAGYRDADGILSGRSLANVHPLIRKRKTPIVVLGDDRIGPYPAVLYDDRAVGEMAYRHFRDLGLKDLAFCGMPGYAFSDARAAGLAKAAVRDQIDVTCYSENIYMARGRGAADVRRLKKWLIKLRKPAGLLAATTGSAHDIAVFCRRFGIRVPEELAILGVDPDDLTSELSTPPLSYIDQGARRLGYEAAAMLHQLMQGAKPPRKVVIAPRAVVAKQSTDVLAVDDPDLARALRFMRKHACDRITVSDVLRNAPMARRTLERGIARILGRSVHDEITRVRLARAQQLLCETNMPMAQIAEACGFEHASTLSALFTQHVGITARDYRRSQSPTEHARPTSATWHQRLPPRT